MTLPVNTAIQIDSRNLTAAEMLAYSASRHNKWFQPRTAPQKSAEPKEQTVTRVHLTAPVERVWTVQHDSHMAAWYEWKGNEPLGFLKLRCRELDLNFDRIVGMTRKRNEVESRSRLIAEVKRRFPDMSSPSLGRLFGGREYTTILHFLHKEGIREPPKPRKGRDYEDTVKDMFFKGVNLRDIAAAIKRSEATVSLIVKKHGWTREKLRLEDYAGQLRDMFDAGKSAKEMAQVVGYSRVHIAAFINRKGWKR